MASRVLAARNDVGGYGAPGLTVDRRFTVNADDAHLADIVLEL